MNTLVHNVYSSGGNIDVYVHVTKDYATIEAAMIAQLRPKWNRAGLV